MIVLAGAIEAGCGAPPAGRGWARVDARTFAGELAAPAEGGTEPVIVDVREPELFAKGHIPGAVNLPWPAAKQRAPVELDPGRPVVLVCHQGPMGDELAEVLVHRGFRQVRNLAGGMAAWRGPTTSGAPAP